MFKLEKLMSIVDDVAPLSISYETIDNGGYDNSGLIVKCSDSVNKILFSLDLSNKVVEMAEELGCDTIITHHPAIYNPVKTLSIDGDTAPIVKAVKLGINIVSMHLNLDMAIGGIDECLSQGLGVKNGEIIDKLNNPDYGYGRQGIIEQKSAKQFLSDAKKTFESDGIIFYGTSDVNKVASFCGSGSDHALKAIENSIVDADTIVTSDIPHHVLKELIELGKNVMIIPHYVSEEYGFNKFYESVLQSLNGKVRAYYFADKRFM